MYIMTRTKIGRRLGALLLALCLALSLIPAVERPAKAAYSDAAMDKLLDWDVLSGYPDGTLRPERNLTRAEFVAMVNRAYGYNTPAQTPFTDVAPSAWYHDDIGSAYKVGYFSGVSPTSAAPDKELTREQAIVLIARNMRLDPVSGEVTEFSDGRECSDWSRGYIRAAQQAGMIGGYPDGSYKPQGNITRGEMSVMLQRALGSLINKPGEHTLSDVYGNVTISSPNTTLKNSTIAGDLYITGGLDLGDITLENVRVLGDIVVAGGGESQSGKDSIILRNVEADSLLVDSIADQFVTLRTEGDTEIAKTVVRSDSFLQDRTRPGQGLLNISLESPDTGAQFTLSGNLETVINKTANSTLIVAMGTVDNLTIDEFARSATLNLDINSTAKALNLDVATSVTGVGDIDTLNVNAPGSTVDMLPDTINIRPGITANIAGEDLNAAQAIESSSDPRLLAGYPKVRNIAPTSATSAYMGNKAGTVYWAVSTTTDGSIPEDELVTPTDDNTRIALNGSLPIEASNKEFTAALERLTPDSNYYLSTVMVDARNRHSPVKVAAFTTPDNTVPAFTTGYPRIVKNWCEPKVEVKKDSSGNPVIEDGKEVLMRVPYFYAQVGAMANKNCQIYYALYPAGSAQPTGQQFRTGSLGKPIQSGVEDISKNVIWLKTFSGLEELTGYDLYLWLTDADGARSSNVQKLTFTTTDGTPPEFQFETPLVVGNPPATSIPTRVNVTENATVYWSIVKHGDDFIKASTGNVESPKAYITKLEQDSLGTTNEAKDKEKELEILRRKIESGSGALRNGSSNVTGDRDVNINITGLTPETAYDIYYVAKDRATPTGNYSEIRVLEGIRTLDTNPPTVDPPVFSHKNEKNEPYADTDIEIIFSENIQQYPAKLNAAGDPITLASFVSPATDADRKAMGEFLSSIISLYNDSGLDPNKAIETRAYNADNTPVESQEWIIDYRNASVRLDPDTGKVTVTLSSSDGALNLKSGATYHFVYNDIQDLATTPNRMRNMPVSSDTFRTISAQVQLAKDVSASTLDGGVANGTNEIDMSFSLRPVSINVDENVLWDILFWSNTTANFEVYTRERGVTAWTKVAPANGSDYSAITVRPNSNEYIAKGRFSHLAQIAQPRIREVEGVTNPYSLDPSKVYEYAIHFTKVGDSTDRNAWNQEISYRISVITADTPTSFDRLNSYTGGISVTDYTWMQTTQSVLEINTTDANSDYFTLYKSFSDRSAPTFTQGYPTFTPQDISAQINVMTDRAGIIYWVVAPMTAADRPNVYEPLIPPTILESYKETTLAIAGAGDFDAKSAPVDGVSRFRGYYAAYKASGEGPSTELDSARPHYIPHKGSDANAPFLLERPTISAIYNPNFGSARVRSGSIRVTGNGVQTIDVPNLDPSTSYFVYLVTQSDGQAIYSDNVMLYQFWTESVYRPKLRIETDGSSVANVRSRNMNAVADYAIFLMTGLPDAMTQSFYSAAVTASSTMDNETKAAFEAAFPAAGHKYKASTFTVADALCEQDDEGGTLYDKYASPAHKDTLRKLITAQTFSLGRLSGSNANLVQDTVDPVNCVTKYGIVAGREYLFIASARSTNGKNATADSYGFCAYQPIYITDKTPPKISTLYGDAYVNLTNAAQAMDRYIQTTTPAADNRVQSQTMSGQVTVHFDKDIYYYVGGSENSPFSTKSGATGDTVEAGATGYPKFRVGGTTEFKIIGASAIGSSHVNEVTLEFKNIPYYEGGTFDVTPNLVSYQSEYDQGVGQLHFRLRFDESSGKAYIDIESARTDWFTRTSVELATTVKKPEVESITLNPSGTINLDVGETRTLTVSFVPVGSTGRIVWTYSGSAISLQPSQDTFSATITAEGTGQAGVRATLYGAQTTDTSKSKTLTINVAATPSITITRDGKSVSNTTVKVSQGKSVALSSMLKNIDASSTDVVFTSSNSDIFVSLSGTVTARGAVGTTSVITATVTDKTTNRTYTSTCRVEITT